MTGPVLEDWNFQFGQEAPRRAFRGVATPQGQGQQAPSDDGLDRDRAFDPVPGAGAEVFPLAARLEDAVPSSRRTQRVPSRRYPARIGAASSSWVTGTGVRRHPRRGLTPEGGESSRTRTPHRDPSASCRSGPLRGGGTVTGAQRRLTRARRAGPQNRPLGLRGLTPQGLPEPGRVPAQRPTRWGSHPQIVGLLTRLLHQQGEAIAFPVPDRHGTHPL